MKYTRLVPTVLCFATWMATAQATDGNDKDSLPGKPYDRWSVEVNGGTNKAVRPFGDGYGSSNASKRFGSFEFDHFDLGVRYMFNPKVGLKFDVGFDKVTDAKNSGSLPFDTRQYRFGLQGVLNLGRVLGFEDFTHSLGLLAHGGAHLTLRTPQMGTQEGVTERDGGVMAGITPQLRLGQHFAFTADFTVISNMRQHLNWDGTNSATENNLTGILYNASVGLTWYIGRHERHADWYVAEDNDTAALKAATEDTAQRLAQVETMLNDTDRDGVPDYLDAQNNTPAGLKVDSKGRYLDENHNGVADELEKDRGMASSDRTQSDRERDYSANALKYLVENGSVNVFYDVNQAVPNTGSTNSVYQIIQYLQAYPQARIKLHGYADVRGSEARNKKLAERRATVLRDFLVKKGIAAPRIDIVPNGADSSYPEGRMGYDLARRVSVELIK